VEMWEVDSQPPLHTNVARDVPNLNSCITDSDSTLLPVHSTNSSKNPVFSMAIMNCQSIFSKKASFVNFISDHSPNIIASCESWLTPSISSSEIFPAGYTV